MRVLISLSVLIAIFLSSCARQPEVASVTTSKQMAYLTPGMNKQQVFTVLGLPESTSAPEPTTEILHYQLETTTYNGTKLKEYIVILKSGFVTQYGQPRNGTKIINGVRIYEVL